MSSTQGRLWWDVSSKGLSQPPPVVLLVNVHMADLSLAGFVHCLQLFLADVLYSRPRQLTWVSTAPYLCSHELLAGTVTLLHIFCLASMALFWSLSEGFCDPITPAFCMPKKIHAIQVVPWFVTSLSSSQTPLDHGSILVSIVKWNSGNQFPRQHSEVDGSLLKLKVYNFAPLSLWLSSSNQALPPNTWDFGGTF